MRIIVLVIRVVVLVVILVVAGEPRRDLQEAQVVQRDEQDKEEDGDHRHRTLNVIEQDDKEKDHVYQLAKHAKCHGPASGVGRRSPPIIRRAVVVGDRGGRGGGSSRGRAYGGLRSLGNNGVEYPAEDTR